MVQMKEAIVGIVNALNPGVMPLPGEAAGTKDRSQITNKKKIPFSRNYSLSEEG